MLRILLPLALLASLASASSWEACQSAVASSAAFDVTKFGAVADGVTVNTKAIQSAINHAAAAATTSAKGEEAFAYIPPGVFVTGSINLTSWVYLCLADGAVLRGSDNAEDYVRVDSITSDTGPFDFPLVCLWEVTRSGILASGTHTSNQTHTPTSGQINGGCNSPPGNHILSYDPVANFLWPQEWNLPGCTHFSCRPKLLVARLSSDLTFSGVSLVNSNLWTFTLSECSGILVDKMYIGGDRNFPNNDGIDCISCTDLVVKDTHISTGDDSIAIITHSSTPLTNITLTNLSLSSSSAAIRISAFEMHATGGVTSVRVENVSITDTNRGVCIAARWGSGVISNVSFSNVDIETHYFGPNFWGAAEPVQITSCWASEEHKWVGTLSNISFENVHMHSENGVVVYSNVSRGGGGGGGEGLAPITGLRFANCSLLVDRFSNITKPSSSSHQQQQQQQIIVHDWRPSREPQVEMGVPISEWQTSDEPQGVPITALYIDGAVGVEVEDSRWGFAQGLVLPWYSKECVVVKEGSSVVERGGGCVHG